MPDPSLPDPSPADPSTVDQGPAQPAAPGSVASTVPAGPDPVETGPAAELVDVPLTAADGAPPDTVESAGPTGPAEPDEDERDESDAVSDLEREGEIAADYLEGLLDIADLDGDIDMDVEGARAMVSIESAELDDLVGERGRVLEALQELTRLAVLRETGERSRLMLDIAGYRATRRSELDRLGRSTADAVRSSGQPRKLDPMTPFERKVVHDAVAAAGLRSESEGEEPRRCVVVLPG